ncbi:golgi uridine diphosphate-N- acetylglucosamine transporter [Coemansia asiatica]|uniref:Golgi uridine diphosphate-N- acetylglucosamine transporter n=1 Tax=Coemansia asiatica TaxID=1052880 RepID=A0A9W8CIJ4_9FUNG|nr:golgi uridine diphosphate-N- acetylglucosamine transporter [Coemansia asiatica]
MPSIITTTSRPEKDISSRSKLKTAAGIVASDWLVVLSFIFGGCCTNVFALESLVRQVPKSGNLITFAQFAFITLIGIPSHLHMVPGRFGWIPRLKPRKVPLRRWIVMVSLYFMVSILNNLALGYKISIPLHIIFRSAGLIANMTCGFLVMHKRYPVKQVMAVIMVSIGVVLATLAGVNDHSLQRDEDLDSVYQASGYMIRESLIGITLLTLGVFLAAMLGLYQEYTYRIYGKHWQEGLFYNHALALPMFLFLYRDIINQAYALSQSDPVSISLDRSVPLVGRFLASDGIHLFTVPWLWISLICNVLSQLVCVSGVHRLTSMSSSLTLNVVLNLRKLVSLVFSVLLFKNRITPGMLFGCALVFLGTFAYSQTGSSSGNSGFSNKPMVEADSQRTRLDEGIGSSVQMAEKNNNILRKRTKNKNRNT